jgi:potassium efflux system protein
MPWSFTVVQSVFLWALVLLLSPIWIAEACAADESQKAIVHKAEAVEPDERYIRDRNHFRMPSEGELTQEIEFLKLVDRPDPAIKARLEVAQETLMSLRQYYQFVEQMKQLESLSKQAPELIAEVKAQIRAEEVDKKTDPQVWQSLVSLASLQIAYGAERAKIAQLRLTLNENKVDAAELERRPVDIKNRISSIIDEITAIEGQREALVEQQGNLSFTALRQTQFLTRTEALRAEWAALEQERANLKLIQELSGLDIELGVLKLARAEALEAELSERISRFRRLDTARVLARTQAGYVVGADAHPLLLRARKVNRRHANDLVQITNKIEVLAEKNKQLTGTLRYINQARITTIEQLRLPTIGPELGWLIRQQSKNTPDVRYSLDLQDRIAKARYVLLDISRQKEQLQDPELYIRSNSSKLEQESLTAADIEVFRGLVADRLLILGKMEDRLQELLSEGFSLQATEEELRTRTRQLDKLIQEKMIWVPSSYPLSAETFSGFPKSVQAHLKSFGDFALAESAWEGFRQHRIVVAMVVAIALCLFLAGPFFRRLQHGLSVRIGNVRKDGYAVTPLAALLVFLRVLWWPMLVFLVGYLISMGSMDSFSAGMGVSAQWLAFFMLILNFFYVLNEAGGVSQIHFRVPEAQARLTRRLLTFSGYTVLIVFGLVVWIYWSADFYVINRLGVLSLAGCSFLLALISWKVGRHHRLFFKTRTRCFWSVAFGVALPILNGILALFGYFESALQVFGRTFFSMLGLLLIFFVYYVLKRMVYVVERRVAFEQALKKRKAQLVARGSTEDIEDSAESRSLEESLDIESISDHMYALLTLLTMVSVLVFLWGVWRDIWPALAHLQEYRLWDVSKIDGSVAHITVATLLGILMIIAGTVAMYRYVGTVLTIMLRRFTHMSSGLIYTLVTTIRYLIVMIAIVQVVRMLGLKWSEIQWLVAALGVGIGIGLQEIIADFFSGLVILYERPIRIGDTITLGNMTGTVTSIRIRSSTVTDWDKKEVVVPNKMFMTEQLVNWTLSDSVTRIVLTYYIASDADTDSAIRLMVEEAIRHPVVLDDPIPEAFLMSMDKGIQQIELRVFVREMNDRLPVRNSLNVAINRRLREERIELSVPRQEIRMVSAKREARGRGEEQGNKNSGD